MLEDNCIWTGRLVVRFLGKDIEKDFDQKRKPTNAKVDPSILREGTGSLHYIPLGATIDDYGNDRAVHSNTSLEECAIVRLDVYIFPPKDSKAVEPKVVNLTRKTGEAARNCLNRLSLNIAKKFKTRTSSGKGKINQQQEAPQSIAIVGGRDQLDVSGMSNSQFWIRGAKDPLTIHMAVEDKKMQLHVEVNPPTVLSVSTFEKFEADLFPGVPLFVQVETLFASRAIVDWYANKELICKDSPVYVPTIDDAEKWLEVMITPVRSNHGGGGCHEAYRFHEPVAAQRPRNTTLDVRPYWQKPREKGGLRVLSYNILADQNAFSGPDRTSFFPWVSESVLKRSRRMPLILHEILAYHADIICLQEVDQIVFDTLLEPVLRYYNYQGFYSVKQTPGNMEGCCMFWSLDKFQASTEDEYHTYSLSRLLERYEEPLKEQSDWKSCSDVITEIFRLRPDLLHTLKTKLGHVVQIAHLRGQDGAPLLLSNTHLFFHPNASHVRLMQLFAIAHQINMEQGSLPAPFILCGDLNTSLGSCAALLMDRHIPRNDRYYRECFNSFVWDLDQDGSTGKEFDYDFPEMRLPDSFPILETAYPDCPDFTHFIVGFYATLDHILMTPRAAAGNLGFLRQAEVPSFEQVKKDKAMPSPTFPSDHIAVVADLAWIPTNCR